MAIFVCKLIIYESILFLLRVNHYKIVSKNFIV
jgi:hypothetical protein